MSDRIPYLILGNPENRRVVLFQEALARRGGPPAEVLSHEALLDDMGALSDLGDEPRIVRIDSAGENSIVERGLLALGYERALALGAWSIAPDELAALPIVHGQVLAPRQLHEGMLTYLHRLEAYFSKHPSWRVLTPPSTIASLFDKRVTQRRLASCGVPVPEFLEGVTTPQELRSEMAGAGMTAVFVKVSCCSSASCLAVYRLGTAGRGTLMTTLQKREGKWFNSLRVQRLDDAKRIDEVLSLILREGAQVERDVPKARLGRAFMDCRILMVGGEPAFRVIRQNTHPITNLHLGGWRGDDSALDAEVSAEAYEAAMQSCRIVAREFPSLHVGVDLMFEPGFRSHRILEANAFGDLLPRLTRDGLDVYEWEIEVVSRGNGCRSQRPPGKAPLAS